MRISCRLPYEKKAIVIDMKPYRLRYNDYTWYVLGKSSFHKGARAFRLNRIRKLSKLDKYFFEDDKFDVSEYLGKAWSLIPEGKLYHVKLRFLPAVARDVAEVEWHHTQEVAFDDDGSAVVQFCVDGLNEITWWIFGYGDKVQVLGPAVLREKIVQTARKMFTTSQQ